MCDAQQQDRYAALRLENQLCFPLYAASREIIRQYRPSLEALDLTYTQYITMMVFWEEKKISVKELGKKLYLDSGTLTPVLKSLEAKGLVKRYRIERCKHSDVRKDRRIVLAVAVTIRRYICYKADVEIRSVADYRSSVFCHLSSEHRCCIPVIVFDGVKSTRAYAAAAAFALFRIDPCFAILVDKRVRTAFLSTSSATFAAFRDHMRMAALVLLHLSCTASAAHAYILYRSAKSCLFMTFEVCK